MPTAHTPVAPPLTAASFDFNAMHEACKKGFDPEAVLEAARIPEPAPEAEAPAPAPETKAAKPE